MKALLFLTLLLSSIYANKTDFSVIVHKPFDAALFDITEDYDRTITAVGFSKEYKPNSNTQKSYTNAFDYLASVSQQYGSQMHILKVDNKANIILSKISNFTKFNEAVAVVKTPTNGYFIGGYTMDGSLLIVKLDANANLIFTKTFGTKNYDRMNNLILMSDGGVLAVGSSITSRSQHDSLFETGLGNNDIYITRFSKDGHKLWSKKYGTQNDDIGIDAVEARDGSIIVVSTSSYNKNRDVSFMRLTENGNRVWLKIYKHSIENEETIVPRKIIRLRDNNFVVSLSQYNQKRKEHIRLVKFDLYQNILIDKEIFTTYPSTLNDIKEFSDGTLIGVGYVKDIHNTDGLAMVLDSNLLMLNQEHYGEENYDVFNAVTILHNSQVAVAGIHTNNDSQESNMWITKLNKDASMSQISAHIGNFHLRLKELFKDEIAQNLLTIKEDLSINLTHESLYFEVGTYKLTTKQKRFLKAFSNKLLKFLSANQAYINTLEISGHTSSEWGTNNFEETYLKNEKLSLERSFATLSYIFKTQDKSKQILLTKIVKGSGESYKNRMMLNDKEDKAMSRRVSFKILLK